jgi:hypothetical protein
MRLTPTHPAALLLLCLCLLVSPLGVAAPENPWELAGERHGTRVWKRQVLDSSFVEFRAETTVRSSLSALLNLFYDLEAAPRWIDHTRRVRALRRDDASREYVLLLETDMPWPIKDRDAVIKGVWKQDPQTLAVMMRGKSAEGFWPENPAYVRNTIRSDWTFIPLGKGDVKVIMEGHVDPRGNLPGWAVNMLIQESPFATLANLKRMMADRRRQAEPHEGVIEPGEDFQPPR